MNCTTCGANLPSGAAACPLCGTPTAYKAGKPGSSPQYDPTVAVPQAGPGGSPHQDPTLPAQPYGGAPPPPSTAYGSPGYGTPPPPPNPYETPSYNAPPQQQNYYGAPPQQQGGYVVPPPQQGGMYGTPQPPRRRSRLGLILGIIALVLIVACAGISFAVYQGVKQAGNTVISSNATSTAEANATSTSSATTPTTSTNTTPTTSGMHLTRPPALALMDINPPQHNHPTAPNSSLCGMNWPRLCRGRINGLETNDTRVGAWQWYAITSPRSCAHDRVLSQDAHVL